MGKTTRTRTSHYKPLGSHRVALTKERSSALFKTRKRRKTRSKIIILRYFRIQNKDRKMGPNVSKPQKVWKV